VFRIAAFILLGAFGACAQSPQVAAPEPYGAVPSARQLLWHELEFYGFVHFTMNTFTDKEWGYGDEDRTLFDPTDFSAEQIASTAEMAGMKGLILTCKHHDGFCLWPSKFTEHSVKNTPWENGKGDMVRDFATACANHGLQFGVYLSPWDRNHADYGKPEYVEYYRQQLRELLSNYGPVFEVWWDGANGGDGYYGGARETRKIERGTYYDWEATAQIVRELQPNAVIFSDAGPDVRWIGNEHGIAGDPCWATYSPVVRAGESKVGPGTTQSELGQQGHRDGALWLPGEADVSIRPGWFYHANQDHQVRDANNLLNLYFKSVGRGSSFLLNLPPDRRGRIHENDVAALREFRRRLDETFAVNLAKGAQLIASNVRGGAANFDASQLLDGDCSTFWCTDDRNTSAELVVQLGEPVSFNVVDLREYLPLGQRVDQWALDTWENGAWVEFAKGQSIGNRRLWRGEKRITTTQVRLRLHGAACPALSEFGIYLEPELPPQ
jgi:alpha-L-fucosidase